MTPPCDPALRRRACRPPWGSALTRRASLCEQRKVAEEGRMGAYLEYMGYMEGLAEGLPRALYVHGSGQEIINFESSMD